MSRCKGKTTVTAAQQNKDGTADYGFDQFLDEPIIDIRTFTFPPREECPLCCVPFPFEKDRVREFYCCGKSLCRACLEESYWGGVEQRSKFDHPDNAARDAQRCPFCRELPPDGEITPLKRLVKRGHSGAMVSLGWATLHGDGVARDEKKAIELYHMASRAGSSKACAWLAERYMKGDIVVKRDLEKAKRLYSRSARLGGEPYALFSFGWMIRRYGSEEECLDYYLYFLASACAGCEEALSAVKEQYMIQCISRDDYAHALRSYQAAREETKSDSRKGFEKRLAEHRTLDDVFDEMGVERISTD